jgi:hypothetical protein
MSRIEERHYDNIVKHNNHNNNSSSNHNFNNPSLSSQLSSDFLSQLDQSLSYSIEKDVDYGYGKIDAIWHISLHPSLPTSKSGFVKIQSSQDGGGKAAADQDWKDNQYSFRKIEEAIGRGIRSGCDKVFLVVENEEMAKSITGRIEWLSSFGSIIRFDAVSISVSPNQHKPSGSIPSQQRVPEGEKIRKEDMKEREEKFDKYNRPKEKEQKKIVKKKQKLN